MQPQDWRISTPEQFLEYAKRCVLEGRSPVTPEDWSMVANYFALNVVDGLEHETLLKLKELLSIPLSADQMNAIADFQIDQKKKLNFKTIS